MNRQSNPEQLTILRKATPVVQPTEERAVAPVRIDIGAISRHHPSFVQLYYAIEARRTSAMPLVVQFISPTAGTGASTVASGYARVAADDCAQPVLYIDCNAQTKPRRGAVDSQPLTLFDALRRGLPLNDAITPARGSKNLLWARLGPGERPLLALGGDRLQSMLDMLRANYPVIVLDTPPTEAPESAAVSRYCDGSVLVVAAGRTKQWDIENAKSLLERLGGQTVGVVLNRERSVMPRWLGWALTMRAVTSPSASWTGPALWPVVQRSAFVAVLAGLDGSEIVDAALDDPALTDAAVLRFEPACTAPCDALMWRLETAGGEALNHPRTLGRYWHRPPYAMTVRLVQYQPGSTEPQILDEGTLGTRGAFAAFKSASDRLAMRFVRDAALGRSRGPAGSAPADAPRGLPGWLDAFREKWRDRLKTEWWSVGTSTVPLDRLLAGAQLGDITWHRPKVADRYLADPFPWPGTNRILCEEMPLSDGVGRIVAVSELNGGLTAPTVMLDDGYHHSYPCTFRDGEVVYCVPEATQRGGTRIYRLDDNADLTPICEPAPNARLADPTLFRWNGRYWLGCTDLDLGGHDNLCLLHATELTGPWTAHARWPVKIDVRGARSAGMLFNAEGRLFRPGQDCARTYGAAVAIHEVLVLTETEFQESLISVLRPNRSGPFPHGLHTLVHDGERFWLDGKRFVVDLGLFRKKLVGRMSRLGSGMGVS